MSRATKFVKLLVTAIRADANAIADVLLTLKTSSGHTALALEILNSSDVSKFSVSPAGNVLAAGTLGVTGASTLTGAVAAGAGIAVTGAATVSTTLGVTGASTLSGAVATGALTVTGAATVSTTLGVTGAATLSSTAAITGTLSLVKGLLIGATARTATASGATTGTILAGETFISVTSAGVNDIMILPAPTPGTIVILAVGANGFELRSSAPASVAINGGTGSDAESAIPANTTAILICESATTWKGLQMAIGGTLTLVEVAAT